MSGPGELLVDPLSVDFGEVEVGASGASVVTVSNVGGSSLELVEAMFAGDGAVDYRVTSELPVSLAPDESVTIGIAFDPVVEGTSTATLTLGHTGHNDAVVVELAGVGVPSLLDRFEQDDPALLFSAGWETVQSPDMSGGSAAITQSGEASVEVVFEGTTVRWIATLAPSYGIAHVTIDGKEYEAVDLYSEVTTYRQVVFEATDLKEGSHNLVIQHTGESNPNASGSTIEVDAIEAAALVMPPNPLDLIVEATKTRGLNIAKLSWAGSGGYQVDIRVDGHLLATVEDAGFYSHHTQTRGSQTFTYQVCEAGSTRICSPERNASW